MELSGMFYICLDMYFCFITLFSNLGNVSGISNIMFLLFLYIKVSVSVTQYQVIITVTRLVNTDQCPVNILIYCKNPPTPGRHNRTMGYFQGFSGPEDFLVTLCSVFCVISYYVSPQSSSLPNNWQGRNSLRSQLQPLVVRIYQPQTCHKYTNIY